MSRFVRVTRGAPGALNDLGLEVLRMALWEAGREVAHVPAYSGAPGRQNFRTLAQERRGVLEPCPEGVYEDVGPLEWAGRAGDYSARFLDSNGRPIDGLGPVVAQVYGARAIMMHWDANGSYAPGSAGCLCPIDLPGIKTAVGWWAQAVPEWVECDWGLGTVARPVVAGKPQLAIPAELTTLGFDLHDGRMQARQSGQVLPALGLRLDYHDGRAGLSVNGLQIDPKRLRAVSLKLVYEKGKN